jgi:hypothetical protein
MHPGIGATAPQRQVFIGGGEGYHGGMRVKHDVEPKELPELNRLLRAHRITADKTQLFLAQDMGFSHGLIALVECGFWIPNDGYIRRMCTVLGLSLADEQKLLTLRAGMPVRQKRGRQR